ncbi:hypothetical protein HMPREF9370_1437 [Neisseria wadsworthii 9715]|uniref:Uncharacterized protein n=1 Tax=Neisseria wadsworthii 9715 TaxID=1030841 RepID=G4CQS7_9NEIS|nr:hypothetical protein HMPREF9370_1437 [Neisseria wadsworthii 9715]
MKQVLLLVFVLLGITKHAYPASEHDVVNEKGEPVYFLIG